MSRPEGFINWVQEGWEKETSYRRVSKIDFPPTEFFNLAYEVTSSLMRGKQWYFLKILPHDLSIDTVYQIASQRKETMKFKSSFFRFFINYLVFFYISDVEISKDILSCLGDFTKARKSFTGNVTEINIFVDTSSGEYLLPYKSGFFGTVPIQRIYKKIRTSILRPYQDWVKSQ